MTVHDAITLLDKAASLAHATRNEHITVQQAVDELKKYISEHEKAEDDHG